MFLPNQVMKEAFDYPQDLIRETESQMNEDFDHFKHKKSKKKHQQEKSIYFKVRVVGKVAGFIDKLKSGTVLNHPEFKNSELQYLKVDGMEKDV